MDRRTASPRATTNTKRLFIRVANAEDVESVTALRLKFLADHRNADPADYSEAFRITTRDFLRRHTEAGTSRTWLANEDGIDVGVTTMLLLDLAPRPEDASGLEGYIVNMYVEPSHRRNGVGKQLLAVCVAAAHDLRLRRLLLHATEAGRPLYAKAGFDPNPNWMELPL